MEFLLAGPILRRVEPKIVSVWVACSEGFEAKLSIWEGNQPRNATTLPSPTYESANIASVRLGEKLFICLVQYTLPDAFALNPISLYSYNITFTKSAGGTETLHSLNLLSDSPSGQIRKKLALGYITNMLPTFVLPAATLENVQIVHGSCRKPHGPGKDTLSSLDHILKKAMESVDPTKRPQQLFLTGDQIYSDDVSIPLMKYLMPLAQELMGKDETLALPSGNVIVNASNFPLCSRQAFTMETGKLTSGEAENHLMGFGEFCAAYLLAWGINAWPDEALNMTDTISDSDLAFLDNISATLALAHIPQSFKTEMGDAEKKTKEINRRKKSYRNQLEALLNYRANLPRVMRALANIPTYMIMDDHEVTDDWFLTQSWRQKVLGSATGRAIIRNGMMAYSLFQDWGNSPVAYASGDKHNLQNHIKTAFDFSNTTLPNSSVLTEIEQLLGLNSNDSPVKWHYKVATGPTHTLVLDTRTRRHFESMASAPGLIQSTAIEEQVPTPASLQNPDVIFIVSPAPVLGMALFEDVVQSFKVKAAAQDYEAWAFNSTIFEQFLDRIQAFKKVIILSGDVHYGFTMSMDYWKKKEAPATGYSVSKIVQLVSSACKNETDMVPSPIFINARINQLQAEGLMPAKRLGWKKKLSMNVTGDVTFNNNMRLKKEPVLLSPGPSWISGSNTVGPAADWAWQFEALMDVRAESARPENIRMKVLADDSGYATNKKEFYEKVMERHIDNSKKHVSRRFVWNNNFGVVKIKKTGTEYTVEHELWHFLADDADDAAPKPYTLFSQSLTFAAEGSYPTIP